MIIQTIRDQLKDAMRSKDQAALDALRGVMSAFTNELVASGKSPQDEVTDDIALKVILRTIKQRQDAIAQFEAGGRTDLAEEDKKQLAVLMQFQPAQMAEADIRAIATAKKDELGMTDKTKMGMLVGAVVKEIAARGESADGGVIKKIIEELF